MPRGNATRPTWPSGPRIAAATATIFGYAILATVAFYPMSIAPARYYLAHRTAAEHAVLMSYFGGFLSCAPGLPFGHLDLWGFPDGGIVQPLAVPALAVGNVLCRWLSLRVTFNVLFLLNLVGSGLVFYRLGRRLRFGSVVSFWLGAATMFHPMVQSFILRGQIENSMLWTVGLPLLASVALLESRRRPVAAFAAAAFLPCTLALFSTPYNAVFYVVLAPVVVLFAALRGREPLNRSVLWRSGLAYVVSVVLILAAIEFYRLGPAAGGLSTLNPGSLEAGLALRRPLPSLLALVQPAGMLAAEQPFLGYAMIGALASAAIMAMARRRVETVVPLAGALVFIVLAAGREYAPAGLSPRTLLLPAAWLDRLVPDFRNVVMLFRALPFAALCAALALASVLEPAGAGRRARLVPVLLTLLLLLDGVLVSPLGARHDRRYCRDQRRDLPAAASAIPRRTVADLPVLDLPPPVGDDYKPLWGRYTYLQTEHRQKLVWMDAIPHPPTSVQVSAMALFDTPRAFMADTARADRLVELWRTAGVGLVTLHTDVLPADEAHSLRAFLDAHLVPLVAGERLAVWRVPVSGETLGHGAGTAGRGGNSP